MTRDYESVRSELDYLKELQGVIDTVREALVAANDALADVAVSLATIASLELTPAAGRERIALMQELANRLATYRAPLAEGASANLATIDLVSGRLLAIAAEAGLDAPSS